MLKLKSSEIKGYKALTFVITVSLWSCFVWLNDVFFNKEDSLFGYIKVGVFIFATISTQHLFCIVTSNACPDMSGYYLIVLSAILFLFLAVCVVTIGGWIAWLLAVIALSLHLMCWLIKS